MILKDLILKYEFETIVPDLTGIEEPVKSRTAMSISSRIPDSAKTCGYGWSAADKYKIRFSLQLNQMRFKQHVVMLIHHGSIGKDDSIAFLQTIGLMDVAEKRYPGTDCRHT